jgi:hypothetical protein
VPVSVLIRRLSIAEVHERQRARHAAEIAAHNAGIVEHLGQRIPPRRAQVLDEFDHGTRRLAR